MNQVQKTALKETAKTLVGLTAISLAVPAVIFLVPLNVIATVLMVGCLGFAVKMIYDTKLSQAKFDAEYNKTVDQ
jgi:ABC-type Na+ efflux pump permease subunit